MNQAGGSQGIANMRRGFHRPQPVSDRWSAFAVVLSLLLLGLAIAAAVPGVPVLANSWQNDAASQTAQ